MLLIAFVRSLKPGIDSVDVDGLSVISLGNRDFTMDAWLKLGWLPARTNSFMYDWLFSQVVSGMFIVVLYR